jgi:hypothetical protein
VLVLLSCHVIGPLGEGVVGAQALNKRECLPSASQLAASAGATGSSLALTRSCPLPSRVLAVMPWVPSCARKVLASEAVVAGGVSL